MGVLTQKFDTLKFHLENSPQLYHSFSFNESVRAYKNKTAKFDQ